MPALLKLGRKVVASERRISQHSRSDASEARLVPPRSPLVDLNFTAYIFTINTMRVPKTLLLLFAVVIAKVSG
ncbi:unnamed protein product [Danaus chrysippus]|uniref:(African queen) hypothetical protein n=1 Tax=Danaus chrysippus TaxID=151541 RepID=A0A8J2MWQ2_9NEOP|nr:unnamed protein product [Danaus chrysippus]